MSETINKNINSDNNFKDRDIKEELVQENKYDKFKKNFKKNYRSPNYYGKNRYSCNNEFRNDNFGKKSFKRNWSSLKSEKKGKKKKLEVGNRLKECDVGITEFIGNEGFFGVIKERYTDFHVNEIALDGEIVKLTNQDILSDGEENENLEDLKKIIQSDTIWDQLQGLKESDQSIIEIDVTNMDKDQRRAIHRIAKTIKNVISQTIDRENKKIMMILPNKKNSSASHNFRKDDRIDWKKKGKYCYFLLHKVNMDTMDALNQLAMNLYLKPNNFTYAGTKDRRACTTQWVSVKKVTPTDILKAAKNVHGAYVGNFKFETKSLKLGMLNGNCFRIALRNVNGTDDQIEKTMISLRDHGFINYYGLQRFGTVAAIPTYEIGKALLQSKWNQAIELILKPREGEQDEDLIEARKIYETTKDACSAYKRIKRCDKIEAILLKGLCISGNSNPQGALDSIPRNARLMYIHAYQSFVWNHMVSRRIKEFGKNPIVGDLVYENNVKENDNEEQFVYDNENEVITEINAEEFDQKINELDTESNLKAKIEEFTKTLEKSPNTSIKEITNAAECCIKIDENEKQSEVSTYEIGNLPPVKVLEENDLSNYTLADVLMPQVGWRVIYPPYAKPWFDEFLAKDGLTTDLRQRNKKYSLGGAYRKILEIPSNLSWKIMHYTEKHSDLIMCDIDEMRKSSPPKDDPKGRFKAIIIQMSLKPSTYATMALREILKSDTSPQAQAAHSAACNAETINLKTSKNDIESEDENKFDNTEKYPKIEEQKSKDDKMEISDTV